MSAAEEEADERLQTTGDLSALSTRSHTCGELADTDVGQRVRLCGWIQFQRMAKFAILRDSYGLTQIVLNDKNHQKVVSKLMPESVLEVMGRVVRRPDKDVNPALTTGAIEVVAEEVNVLNECRKDVPFIIRDYQKVNEKTRLEFRYIDLRHPKMQSILRLRQFLTQQYGFVEVETPTLFKATPGGAKEFVVPTEFKDCYYNLVQSPQQFKQLLMVGGIDRYFQIARCYRNEGTKPDRQPEFTQLDLEMSFTTSDGIMSLIEELIHSISFVENYEPFPRMTYADAMQHYGTDKPDLRSDIKIRAVDTYEMNAPIDKDVCLTLVINDLDKDINDEILRYMDSIGDIKRELQFSGQLTHEFAEDSNQLNFDGVKAFLSALKANGLVFSEQPFVFSRQRRDH
ncbi:unnamed protein product [Oppiella nova]|uniref:Lysine--tRNA ligase n=1 Tax=Oppiella nova TaxID=334625 RepID=A0A7R9QMU1_9ACAR|nr:unnamed protein product [Oppiella nova]CAG2169040.1 unnamed protein product [Oppiella nova]